MAIVEYSNRQNPRCEQERTTCAKNKKGRCQILHDTHFKRPCPFFKTKEQIRSEQKGEKHDKGKTQLDPHRTD